MFSKSVTIYKFGEIPESVSQICDREGKRICDMLNLDEHSSYSWDWISYNRKELKFNPLPYIDLENDEILKLILKMKNLLYENSGYFNFFDINDPNIYYIMTKVDDIPYGSVFAFIYENNGIKSVYIQGITKFLSSFQFKDCPKLNSLIIPAVEDLAKSLNIDRIYCIPIYEQKKILLKHYGFIETEGVRYPNYPLAKSLNDGGDGVKGLVKYI